jgi:hypothetical protein
LIIINQNDMRGPISTMAAADNVVGKQEVLQAADSLEDLLNQTTSHLTTYANHTQDLQASGQLTGAAGDANVVTGGEIHDAIAKITARWNTAIDMLRNSVNHFEHTDIDNASNITQVAGAMGGGLTLT